jgi:hypothetical protein
MPLATPANRPEPASGQSFPWAILTAAAVAAAGAGLAVRLRVRHRRPATGLPSDGDRLGL